MPEVVLQAELEEPVELREVQKSALIQVKSVLVAVEALVEAKAVSLVAQVAVSDSTLVAVVMARPVENHSCHRKLPLDQRFSDSAGTTCFLPP
jgi:hypothetical protein